MQWAVGLHQQESIQQYPNNLVDIYSKKRNDLVQVVVFNLLVISGG